MCSYFFFCKAKKVDDARASAKPFNEAEGKKNKQRIVNLFLNHSLIVGRDRKEWYINSRFLLIPQSYHYSKSKDKNFTNNGKLEVEKYGGLQNLLSYCSINFKNSHMKVIRMATTQDAAQILDIYAPFIENTVTSFELEVPTILEFSKRIEKYLLEAPWLVCEEDNQVIGYAYASPHRGRAAYQWNREVSVYVHKDHYRKGIARILYDALFQLLRVQGYGNALAGIVQPNEASERFHKSMGFQKVGTYKRIGFKLGAWRDVTWYDKFLLDTSDITPPTILSMEDLITSEEYQNIIHKTS